MGRFASNHSSLGTLLQQQAEGPETMARQQKVTEVEAEQEEKKEVVRE